MKHNKIFVRWFKDYGVRDIWYEGRWKEQTRRLP